jgi:GTP-binding protein
MPYLRASFKAEHGKPGELDYLNGVDGSNCRVPVPLGTVVFCNETGKIIGELVSADQELVVATGGGGGKGNAAATQRVRGEKAVATPPAGGQKRWLRLELRLVADIGLVGMPNAGKSTFLDAVTNAKPKIADYAFTTIVPNLGVCEILGGKGKGGDAMVIADIPGLVEGAHEGVGLGRGFLRHVERCELILHIVNGDSVDPVADFKAINRELLLFSPTLASKPQVVVVNKVDLPRVADNLEELLVLLRKEMTHKRLLSMSAAARIGIDEVIERSYNFRQKLQKENDFLIASTQRRQSEETSILPENDC